MAIVEHFGLGRDPFAPTVDPADAFESQAFTAARDAVLRELAGGARIVAVVGAAGTGKTLLLQAVEKALARAGRQVRRLDRGDLLSDTMTTGDVLLIDEADRIDDAGIAALARAGTRPGHPAVVLARTRRLDHIDSPVAVRTVALDELGSSDARDFVIDRVRRAGGDAAMFTPGALGAITYAAAGSPRLLRLLASGAMFQAAQEGANRIEMGHARRAIAMQRGGAAGAIPEPALSEIAPAAAVAEPASAPVPLMVSPRAERAPAAAEPPEPAASTTAPAPAEPIVAPPPPPPTPATAAMAVVAEEADAGFTTSRRRPLAAAAVVALLAAAAGLFFWQRPTSEAPPPAAEVVEAAPATVIAKAPEPEPAMVAAPAPASPQPEVEPRSQPAPEAERSVTPAPAPVPEPATEVAAAPAAEPVAETPPRIVVRYAGGQPGAADAAGRIADLLRARGHDVADVRAAPGRIRQATTRYTAGDRKAGESVNSAFETVLRAYQPGAISRAAPSADGDEARGTIEVWVPDSAAGASRPLRTDLPPG